VPTLNSLKLSEICRVYTSEIISRLVNLLRDPETNDRIVLDTCRELLDRAHGRPAQELTVEQNVNIKPVVNIFLAGSQPDSQRVIDVTPARPVSVIEDTRNKLDIVEQNSKTIQLENLPLKKDKELIGQLKTSNSKPPSGIVEVLKKIRP
jgi:hypothetical protein